MKLKSSLLCGLSTGLLLGCTSAGQNVLPAGRQISVIPLVAEQLAASPETVIDTGRAGGGQVSLKLDFPSQGEFETQGQCTVTSHLVSLRVFLIEGSTSFGLLSPLGILGDISLKALPNISGWYPVNVSIGASGGTRTVTFRNVGAGQYYLAVAAFNGPNGTGTNITSILGGLLSGGSISGTGTVAVTDLGGESGAGGRINIGPGPTYPLLNGSSPALGATLNLGGILTGPC